MLKNPLATQLMHLPYLKVHEEEPINGYCVKDLAKQGLVYLEEKGSRQVKIHISKPLLRMLVERTERLGGFFNDLLGYMGTAVDDVGNCAGENKTAVPLDAFSDDMPQQEHPLQHLLYVCRGSSHVTLEMAGIVSLLVMRTARLLLSPLYRPAIDNMRPGANVIGNARRLRTLLDWLKEDIQMMDREVEKAWEEYVTAQRRVEVSPQDQVQTRMLDRAVASSRYTAFRYRALQEVNIKLVERGDPPASKGPAAAASAGAEGAGVSHGTAAEEAGVSHGTAALTKVGTVGVDACLRTVRKRRVLLYFMQDKGQVTGQGVGVRRGGDHRFTTTDARNVIDQAKKYITKNKINEADIVALEVLTTKELAAGVENEFERALHGVAWCVVLIHRGNLREAMGEIFGGLAARLMNEEEVRREMQRQRMGTRATAGSA